MKTKNGRTALWYSASEGHNTVLYYLLREKHDSYSLLEDRRVRLRFRLKIGFPNMYIILLLAFAGWLVGLNIPHCNGVSRALTKHCQPRITT